METDCLIHNEYSTFLTPGVEYYYVYLLKMSECSEVKKDNFRSRIHQSAAEKLIQLLSSDQISDLENEFKSGNYEEGMDKTQFINTMKKILVSDKNEKLFSEFFDLYENDGRLNWNITLNGLISAFPENSCNLVKLKLLGINKSDLTKRDTIAKILTIETPTHFCYTVYSKYGRTGIYDVNFIKLATYHVIMSREDIHKTENERRRRNRWITDAAYLPDLKKIAVLTTARSLVVYDVVGLKHLPLFLILSTPNIPKCLAYKSVPRDSSRHLFIGDDSGSVLVFSFVHKKEPLFRKKHNDKLSLHYWEKLIEDKEYVRISQIKNIHKDIIREIIYCQEDNTLTTCSRDPKASVIKLFFDHKKPTMIYEMPKGASTMTFSKKLNLLITGSSNGTIRLWNTLVITTAIAVLKNHNSGIKSIIILETLNLFISCDKQGIINLWNLDEQKCIQTILLSFPCLKEQGKTIEWPAKCIILGPKKKLRMLCTDTTSRVWEESSCKSEDYQMERSNIWISCCNYLANLNLEYQEENLRKHFEMPQLEPPPRQNNVFIPSSWLLSEKCFRELKEKISCDIEFPEKFRDYHYVSDMNELKRKEFNTKINQKIALLDEQKREMQENVLRNAPYLALKLHDIEELTLSYTLVTHGKEQKTIMDRTRSILAEAGNKDMVFSELSSSRSKSSRSSVVEFDF